MRYIQKDLAYLVLEDGMVFSGKSAGKKGTSTGEICFNTGMTGYQEIFTDPSYTGQIVVMTNVHIGNYGVHPGEVESESIKISGMVCKKFNHGYSRKSGTDSLQSYFEQHNIVAISDVDTRALVRYIRDKGAMNCIISSEISDLELLRKRVKEVPSMEGMELSSKVSCKNAYTVGNPDATYKIALLDFGVKKNIIRSLVERDCYVKVFPITSDFEEIMEFNPNGFQMSNGPGDPSVMKNEIALISKIINTDLPVFGICLGHQLIALSQGISTFKMHKGHRGINHPVKNLITGKSEITSQNHGFSVRAEDIASNSNIEITHINLNDNTIEGIRLKNRKVFSVQYHPEACPGPWDSRYLFDQFIFNMKENMAKVTLQKV
ncbi:MAG: glutamine-hydrolyzing carbamoyl-phosphate synthase small subunit [Bacteroidota bacterium]